MTRLAVLALAAALAASPLLGPEQHTKENAND
jgi:hypothetical protein